LIDAELQRDAEDVLRRIAAARAGGPTFGALLDAFLESAATTVTHHSLSIYRHKAMPLRLHFGAMPAASITKTQARAYVPARMAGAYGRVVGKSTAEQELRMAQGVLNLAVDNGALSHNPIARLKRKRPKPNKQAALLEEHLPAVVSAAPDLMTAVFIVVCFDSGCRRNEARYLRREDIDRRAVAFRIRNGKGNKERTVATTERAIAAIDRMPVVLGNPFVFASTSTRSKGKPMCAPYINRLVAMAVKASGIEAHYGGRKVRVHGLRRGHATNAVERGVDILAVQEQLGHEHLSTTTEYLEARLSHRLRAMRVKFDTGLSDPLVTSDLGPRRPARRANPDAEKKQATDSKIVDTPHPHHG
jgi:integrase